MECADLACTLHRSWPPCPRGVRTFRGDEEAAGAVWRGNPFHAPVAQVSTSPGFGRWGTDRISVLRLRDQRFDVTIAASTRRVARATKEAKIGPRRRRIAATHPAPIANRATEEGSGEWIPPTWHSRNGSSHSPTKNAPGGRVPPGSPASHQVESDLRARFRDWTTRPHGSTDGCAGFSNHRADDPMAGSRVR